MTQGLTAPGHERAFPVVEEYLGTRLGVDLASVRPGETLVVETERRLRREVGYGYLRALWWIELNDGRSVLSVPPSAGPRIRELVVGARPASSVHDEAMVAKLKAPVNEALARFGLAEIDHPRCDVCFACDGHLVRRHGHGDCHRLVGESIPAADGLRLPVHCFPDGVVYAVVEDGKAVSIAHAHKKGVMEDTLTDMAVPGTAEPYRGRGYAKTVVSAVVDHFTRTGGEAYYVCSPDNAASVATARSVGFVPYGRSLVLGAPASDLEGG